MNDNKPMLSASQAVTDLAGSMPQEDGDEASGMAESDELQTANCSCSKSAKLQRTRTSVDTLSRKEHMQTKTMHRIVTKI